MKQLRVLFDEAPMGIMTRTSGGQTQFRYDDDWLSNAAATRMSLSLPLEDRTFKGAKLDSFLWGLLPDNEGVIERWAADFQVSPRNAFGLLTNVGRDVAGAVSFVPMDDDQSQWSQGALEDISVSDIGQRLAELEANPSAWTGISEQGRFSLAGAQGKFALRFDEKHKVWQIPTGSEPTTHILKPRMNGLSNQEVNEHLTLKLAVKLGLPAAESQVLDFDGHKAVVVKRYDRLVIDEQVRRIHQEDFCQALGIHPAKKYQNDGGPGAVQLIKLLRENASNPDQDIDTFFRALAFNYAVWGTDAHAKNYSLMLSGEQVVLAPLYDLNSYHVYAAFGLNEKPVKLAMNIGGESEIKKLTKKHWIEFAQKAQLDPDYVTETVRDMVAHAPAALEEVLAAEPLLRGASKLPELFMKKLVLRSARQVGDDVWPQTRQPAPWASQFVATSEGDVWVDAHSRNGKPIAGHWRKRPDRS